MESLLDKLKKLKGKKLFDKIEEIKKEVECIGYSYLSNTEKTILHNVNLVCDGFSFTYKMENKIHFGKCRGESIIYKGKYPVTPDMLNVFSIKLIKEIDGLNRNEKTLDILNNIILSNNKRFSDYLKEPYFDNIGRILFNNDVEKVSANYNEFYKINNDIVYLEGEKYIYFNTNNIKISEIYENLDDDTITIKTNYEDIIITIETHNYRYGNTFFKTDDNIKDFINKKIKRIELTSSGEEYEFLKIITIDGDYLTYSLQQEDYYSSGFSSKSKIFAYLASDNN